MNYRIVPMDAHTWRIEEYDGAVCVFLYLLEGSRQAMLIDSGVGMIDAAAVVKTLTELPISVLNTHGHFDHCGGNPLFETAYLHEADREIYLLHSDAFRRMYFPHYPGRPGRENARWIQDGAVFDLGGRTLRVIHTPGHSHGSLCVLDEEQRWLFTGDTCCKGDVLLHLDGSATVEEYAFSIRRLQHLRPLFLTTWPGHHETPVPPEILDLFQQGAQAICQGTARGKPIETDYGKALCLKWGEIAIVYREDRIYRAASEEDR